MQDLRSLEPDNTGFGITRKNGLPFGLVVALLGLLSLPRAGCD